MNLEVVWWASCELNTDSLDYESNALPLSYWPNLVRVAGLEPASHSAGDFKSPVVTNFTTPALFWPAHVESNHESGFRRPMLFPFNYRRLFGADNWIRTSDLFLTKKVHYLCVISALVQPVGIEPTSDGLQPPAMTTSAKVANSFLCFLKNYLYLLFLIFLVLSYSVHIKHHEFYLSYGHGQYTH